MATATAEKQVSGHDAPLPLGQEASHGPGARHMAPPGR